MGLFNNAIAMPSLCFIPIENCPALFFPVPVKPDISRTSSIRPSEIFNSSVLTLRFSLAVRFPYKGGVSINAPMFDKSLLFHGCLLKIILPLVGFKIPAIIFNVVDFPAPLGPKRP